MYACMSILLPLFPLLPFILLLLSSVTEIMANLTRATLHTMNFLIGPSCTVWALQCGASESPGCEMRQATKKSSRLQYALNRHRGIRKKCTKGT